jgi:hypothetical protein
LRAAFRIRSSSDRGSVMFFLTCVATRPLYTSTRWHYTLCPSFESVHELNGLLGTWGRGSRLPAPSLHAGAHQASSLTRLSASARPAEYSPTRSR